VTLAVQRLERELAGRHHRAILKEMTRIKEGEQPEQVEEGDLPLSK
jgi:hypothetical protein